MYLDRGTAEYVVWRVEDHAVDWFVLRGDHYELLNPGPDGILRSEVMPGLWLDPDALVAGDDTRLLAVLHQGIASAAHSSFAQRLQP